MPAELRLPPSRLPAVYIGEEVLHMPEPEWLMEDFIQDAGLTLVYGPPGGGKSLVMQAWANVLAAPGEGWAWMGRKRRKQARVLYVMGEGQGGLRGRLLAWKRDCGVRNLPPVEWIMEPVEFWRPPQQRELTATQAAIVDYVTEYKHDVIFLDTLAATFGGGNENMQQDMNQYLQVCAELQKVGCAIVIAHHNSKDSTELRGSTVLKGAADTVIYLKPTMAEELPRLERVKLIGKKQKDGIPFLPINLVPHRYEVDTKVGESLTLGWDDAASREEETRQEVLDMLLDEPGLTKTKVVAGLKGKTDRLRQVIDRLIEEDVVEKRGSKLFVVSPDEVEEL